MSSKNAPTPHPRATSLFRHVLALVATQIRRTLLDRGTFFWLIAMPLAIIGVLGMVLNSLMADEYVPPRPVQVAVAASGPDAGVFDLFAARPELVVAVAAPDGATAREWVLERRVDAAVIVGDRFPDEPIQIVAFPASPTAELLEGMLRTFALSVQAARATDVSVQRLEVAGAADVTGADGLPEWLQTNALGYYSVAISAMFVMYAAHTAAVASTRDRASDVYARILSLGVRPSAYLLSGAVVGTLMALLFLLTMTIATRTLFGVPWGEPLPWAIMTLLSAIVAAALSFFLMTILPRTQQLEGAGSLFFTFLAFLGGSMTPLHVLPEWFLTSLEWVPSRAILSGYLKVAQGAGLQGISGELSILSVTAIAIFGFSGMLWAIRQQRGASV